MIFTIINYEVYDDQTENQIDEYYYINGETTELTQGSYDIYNKYTKDDQNFPILRSITHGIREQHTFPKYTLNGNQKEYYISNKQLDISQQIAQKIGLKQRFDFFFRFDGDDYQQNDYYIVLRQDTLLGIEENGKKYYKQWLDNSHEKGQMLTLILGGGGNVDGFMAIENIYIAVTQHQTALKMPNDLDWTLLNIYTYSSYQLYCDFDTTNLPQNEQRQYCQIKFEVSIKDHDIKLQKMDDVIQQRETDQSQWTALTLHEEDLRNAQSGQIQLTIHKMAQFANKNMNIKITNDDEVHYYNIQNNKVMIENTKISVDVPKDTQHIKVQLAYHNMEEHNFQTHPASNNMKKDFATKYDKNNNDLYLQMQLLNQTNMNNRLIIPDFIKNIPTRDFALEKLQLFDACDPQHSAYIMVYKNFLNLQFKYQIIRQYFLHLGIDMTTKMQLLNLYIQQFIKTDHANMLNEILELLKYPEIFPPILTYSLLDKITPYHNQFFKKKMHQMIEDSFSSEQTFIKQQKPQIRSSTVDQFSQQQNFFYHQTKEQMIDEKQYTGYQPSTSYFYYKVSNIGNITQEETSNINTLLSYGFQTYIRSDDDKDNYVQKISPDYSGQFIIDGDDYIDGHKVCPNKSVHIDGLIKIIKINDCFSIKKIQNGSVTFIYDLENEQYNQIVLNFKVEQGHACGTIDDTDQKFVLKSILSEKYKSFLSINETQKIALAHKFDIQQNVLNIHKNKYTYNLIDNTLQVQYNQQSPLQLSMTYSNDLFEQYVKCDSKLITSYYDIKNIVNPTFFFQYDNGEEKCTLSIKLDDGCVLNSTLQNIYTYHNQQLSDNHIFFKLIRIQTDTDLVRDILIIDGQNNEFCFQNINIKSPQEMTLRFVADIEYKHNIPYGVVIQGYDSSNFGDCRIDYVDRKNFTIQDDLLRSVVEIFHSNTIHNKLNNLCVTIHDEQQYMSRRIERIQVKPGIIKQFMEVKRYVLYIHTQVFIFDTNETFEYEWNFFHLQVPDKYYDITQDNLQKLCVKQEHMNIQQDNLKLFGQNVWSPCILHDNIYSGVYKNELELLFSGSDYQIRITYDSQVIVKLSSISHTEYYVIYDLDIFKNNYKELLSIHHIKNEIDSKIKISGLVVGNTSLLDVRYSGIQREGRKNNIFITPIFNQPQDEDIQLQWIDLPWFEAFFGNTGHTGLHGINLGQPQQEKQIYLPFFPKTSLQGEDTITMEYYIVSAKKTTTEPQGMSYQIQYKGQRETERWSDRWAKFKYEIYTNEGNINYNDKFDPGYLDVSQTKYSQMMEGGTFGYKLDYWDVPMPDGRIFHYYLKFSGYGLILFMQDAINSFALQEYQN